MIQFPYPGEEIREGPSENWGAPMNRRDFLKKTCIAGLGISIPC
ncbi:MAG: twin-arginine translocation signal domain-containing protein [Deltaproteobacteria bacterium]|nr:twin-arginine translocation signal domain-containing protein [Deltaproteobacteria bacterium]